MNMYQGNDRVRQVNWLRQEALDILNYDMDGKSSADDLVDFWKSQSVEIPQWFDNSDEQLLRRFVAEAQQ